MPLEQAAAAARRPRSGERQRARLSRRLERVLGLDEDRRLQGADAARSCSRTISRGQLSLHRAARADHAARHQRLQSAGDQCDPRQHLGQLLVRVVQDAAVGRARSRSAIRSPARRWTTRCRPAAAATSGRPRSSASGRRRRSCRTTPSARSSGARRSRRACGRSSRSIEQMLWPERRDKDPLFGTEAGPGVGVIDRITVDSYLEVPEGYISPPLRPLVGLARRLFPVPRRRGRLGEGRSVPERHADRPDHQHRSARRRTASSRARGAHRRKLTHAGEARAARAERQPRLRGGARRPGRRHVRRQQVQGPRRQQGPLLRHRLLHGRTRL